jgi:hypothetical protein
MDWIERIWHINPDNGSGTLEVAIMLAVVLLVVFAVREGRQRRHVVAPTRETHDGAV